MTSTPQAGLLGDAPRAPSSRPATAYLVFMPVTRAAARFESLPAGFLAVVIGLVVVYLLLVETAKRYFFATLSEQQPRRHRAAAHRAHRRAGRFSHAGPCGGHERIQPLARREPVALPTHDVEAPLRPSKGSTG
jgi:hypothetical protein